MIRGHVLPEDVYLVEIKAVNASLDLESFPRKPVSVFSVMFVIEVCFVTPYRHA